MITVRGLTFVSSTGKLKYGYEMYFRSMGVSIDEWGTLDEGGRKELIRTRDEGLCQISGDPNADVHEIITRGSSGIAALAPWNMICLSREWHVKEHDGHLVIKRFDPLDMEEGLIVEVDEHERQKSRIFFYEGKGADFANFAHSSSQLLDNWYKVGVANDWQAAERLAWLYENDAAGYVEAEGTFNSVVAQSGVSLTRANRLRRSYIRSRDLGVLGHALKIAPRRVDRIMRDLAGDRDLIIKTMVDSVGLADSEFDKLVRSRKKDEKKTRKRRYFVIQDGKKKLVSATSIEEVPGEIIVDGVLKRDARREVEEVEEQ